MEGCGRKIGPYPCCSIITGDAKELAKAIPDESVDLIVTDPPFNLGKDYGPLVDDNRPIDEYLLWYEAVAQECYRVMGNGYAYVSCAPAQLWDLRPIWESVGFRWRLFCIWWGPNYAGPTQTIINEWGVCYEPVMLFLKGPRRLMFNVTPGTNSDAIMRHTRPQRSYHGELHRVHPTQKPIALYRNIIARSPGDIILDLFCGSGSVIIAAKGLSRHYLGFEINPNTAEQARERVANSPSPLFVTEGEQASLL